MRSYFTLVFCAVFALMSPLKGDNPRTILVTAATSYFGHAVTHSLAQEGYNLILGARNQEKLALLEMELSKTFPKVAFKAVHIDFMDTESIERAKAEVSHIPISGIVLIGPRPSLAKEEIPSSDQWSQNFQLAFSGPLEVVRQFAPQIQNGSSIVIISGITSKTYWPSYPNTNVLRIAWAGEVKNLAHFFGKQQVRVNAISPGPILTQYHLEKLQEGARKKKISLQSHLSNIAHNIPLGHWGKTDDVANLVSFLLSSKAGHINGTNIALDGGESNSY